MPFSSPVLSPDGEETRVFRRVAAELHDGIVQELFATRLDLDELLELPGVGAQERELVHRIASRIEDGSNHVRALLLDLFDTDRGQQPGADASIEEGLQAALANFRQRTDITIDLQIVGDGGEPGAESRALLLRAVREGLANVIKHAQASQVGVHLVRGCHWWTAEIDDDGVGDPADLRLCFGRGSERSFGLRSVSEDTRGSGGRMWIRRAETLGGVSIGVAVPTGKGASTV
jgi:signal transduction histidine kinase